MTEPLATRSFVMHWSRIASTVLVPEIQLHLALHAHDIFEAAYDHCDGQLGAMPYWAFAWPGGQALARYLLDHPELVRDRSILDLGAGSAIAGIAAMKAGAKRVVAADIDPLAAMAAVLNAEANAVAITATTDDLLGTETDFDLVIVGDLVYEPDLKDRVGTFLGAHHKRGTPMLYGDRTTARRPPGDFRLLAEYKAPLTPAMVDDFVERARVWQL